MYSYNTLTEAPEAARRALGVLEGIAPDKHTTLVSHFRRLASRPVRRLLSVVVVVVVTVACSRRCWCCRDVFSQNLVTWHTNLI